MVSIILPVNRDDGFLDEAILSVLNQTYKDFEFLIIANNCSDDLWTSLNEYSKQDTRIRIYRLTLGGLTFALNYGINIAKGKYIARMDADDICIENRLEKQFDFLESHTEIDLVGSLAYYIDDKGEKLNRKCFLPETHEQIAKSIKWKSTIIHPSVMAKKEFFIQLGGYKFGFYGEDYELWIRGYLLGYKYYNIQEKLLMYRSHSNQLSSNTFNERKMSDMRAMLYHKRLLTGYVGFRAGSFIQSRICQKLILSTSKVRNIIKQYFKKGD